MIFIYKIEKKMKSLKLTNDSGERNTDALQYNRFKCRFTKGINIPDWRIVKVDEPNSSSYYVTLQIMAGETPLEILKELDSYKGVKIDMSLEHLNSNNDVVLTQSRNGYVYGGAICQSFRADATDDKPMTINIKFNKPKSN
jgi:hypothetical protein